MKELINKELNIYIKRSLLNSSISLSSKRVKLNKVMLKKCLKRQDFYIKNCLNNAFKATEYEIILRFSFQNSFKIRVKTTINVIQNFEIFFSYKSKSLNNHSDIIIHLSHHLIFTIFNQM